MRGISFNFSPKLTDQDAEVLLLSGAVAAPDALENRAVGEHPAGVRSENREQLEFLGRQTNLEVAAVDSTAIEVDHEVAPLDASVQVLPAPDRPAQRGPHVCQELLRAEWLGDIVISPGIQRLNLVAFFASD